MFIVQGRLINKCVAGTGDFLIDFGRSPFWNCPAPEELSSPPTSTTASAVHVQTSSGQRPAAVLKDKDVWAPLETKTNNDLEASQVVTNQVAAKPWFIPPIACNEPENRVFYVHIGPTGGSQGYNAITGNLSTNLLLI